MKKKKKKMGFFGPTQKQNDVCNAFQMTRPYSLPHRIIIYRYILFA